VASGMPPGGKGRPGGGLVMLGGGGGRETLLRCCGTSGKAGRPACMDIRDERDGRLLSTSGNIGSSGRFDICDGRAPRGGRGGACGGAPMGEKLGGIGIVPFGTSGRFECARSSKAARRRSPSCPRISGERPRLGRPSEPCCGGVPEGRLNHNVWGAGKLGIPGIWPGPRFKKFACALKRT